MIEDLKKQVSIIYNNNIQNFKDIVDIQNDINNGKNAYKSANDVEKKQYINKSYFKYGVWLNMIDKIISDNNKLFNYKNKNANYNSIISKIIDALTLLKDGKLLEELYNLLDCKSTKFGGGKIND